MKLTYVTNTDLKESSGGGSGVNFAMHNQLGNAFDIEHMLVIKPKKDLVAKTVSGILKRLGMKRNYHAFSENVLRHVKTQFQRMSGKDDATDFYFFHGFTQWIKTRPHKPYFCFNDACFATYVKIYNNVNEFKDQDLQRIFNQEKEWLSNATLVFFRSNWALEETKKAYGLGGANFVNVGVGGFIDIPDKDSFTGEKAFLFIAREFGPKGGYELVQAFKHLSGIYENITLNIVGDDPGEVIDNVKGANYLGFFNKQIDAERRQLEDIFSESMALVHPTLKDTNTLVISELAYFGCPAISSNKFAIPEYLINGQTGFLIDNPRDVDEIILKMEKMITMHASDYTKMRYEARKNAIENNTWDHVGKRIIKSINSVMTEKHV